MPIAAGGQVLGVLPPCLENFNRFCQWARTSFTTEAERLKSEQPTTVDSTDRYLFVGRREVATALSDDKEFEVLATDDLQRCHAVFLRCPVTDATSLGVFDGSSIEDGVELLVKGLYDVARNHNVPKRPWADMHIDLHVFGGYDDSRGLSSDLTMKIIRDINDLETDQFNTLIFNLRTFCCSKVNSKSVKKDGTSHQRPVLTGVGMRVKTGEVFPIKLEDSFTEPISRLRNVRYLFGPKQINKIYNWLTNHVMIPAFHYQPNVESLAWRKPTDDMILQNFSTAPSVEPAFFAPRMRGAIAFARSFPDPRRSIFKNQHEICQIWKDGNWELDYHCSGKFAKYRCPHRQHDGAQASAERLLQSCKTN